MLPQRRAPPALTLGPALRGRVPLAWRIAARRLPALLLHYTRGPLAPDLDLPFPHVQAERSSPLRRAGTTYDAALQAAKEQNVARAAALLDGVTLAPGEVFSWHRRVGPPVGWRGFVPGPELREGRLAEGVGGGACQVANLLVWLALHAGVTVVERHRHGLDLFPDDGRDVPFGCGATVFYPHRDLKLRNDGAGPVCFRLRVDGGALRGSVAFNSDPGWTWEIVEDWHQFVRRADGIWRENHLSRRWIRGGEVSRVEPLFENRARVCYDVDEVRIGPDRPRVP